jgi:hypothetical protein
MMKLPAPPNRHAYSSAGLEDWKNGAMSGVLGQQGAGHCDAVAQRLRCFAGNKRFAAQDAVLIRKRKAHQLKFLLDDCFVDGGSGARLRFAP